MPNTLTLLISEIFWGKANSIKITIDEEGVSTDIDGSKGFVDRDTAEEFGIIDALYDALSEALTGLIDAAKTADRAVSTPHGP